MNTTDEIEGVIKEFRQENSIGHTDESGEFIPKAQWQHAENWLRTTLSTLKERWIREGREQAVERIHDDYVGWVCAGNISEYGGTTPFAKWREDAEVQDMKTWK